MWEFMGHAGTIISIAVNADVPASLSDETTRVPDGFDTLLVVRAPDGSTIAENDDIEAGIVTISYIERLLLPEDGLYEIEIRSWDNRSGGSYTLVIESIEIGPTVTPSPSSQEQ